VPLDRHCWPYKLIITTSTNQCVIIIYIKPSSDTFSDRIAHRTHGWCKSAAEDRSTVSAHLLAAGPQGAHFHQLSGRTHEHGREVETEDRLRTRRGRIAVSVQYKLL